MKINFIRDDLESEKEDEIQIDTDTTAEELLDLRDIQSEEVLVAVNGTIVSNNRRLEEGDTVKVMDVIAGG